MKYEAVIFDLFGTLVNIFSRAEYNRVLMKMAAALSIPADDFSRAWIAGGEARTLGKVASPMGSLVDVCRHLGAAPTQVQLEKASEARLDYYSRNMRPRPQAVALLKQLTERVCSIGLISNCASEVFASWEKSPFSDLIKEPVFSCSVGLKKPDPRIYEAAAVNLGVETSACLYVADGDSGELRGALDSGMDAVRIRVPYDAGTDALRVNEEDWHGLTITSFKQVLDLVR